MTTPRPRNFYKNVLPRLLKSLNTPVDQRAAFAALEEMAEKADKYERLCKTLRDTF